MWLIELAFASLSACSSDNIFPDSPPTTNDRRGPMRSEEDSIKLATR